MELIAPQGRIALIDDPETLDVNPLKGKSLSLHWEFMFTRPLRETADIERQGEILVETARLVDEGIIRPTATQSCTASMLPTCAAHMRCWNAGIWSVNWWWKAGTTESADYFYAVMPASACMASEMTAIEYPN